MSEEMEIRASSLSLGTVPCNDLDGNTKMSPSAGSTTTALHVWTPCYWIKPKSALAELNIPVANSLGWFCVVNWIPPECGGLRK